VKLRQAISAALLSFALFADTAWARSGSGALVPADPQQKGAAAAQKAPAAGTSVAGKVVDPSGAAIVGAQYGLAAGVWLSGECRMRPGGPEFARMASAGLAILEAWSRVRTP